MAKLIKKDVLHVARLAKLNLNDSEVKKYLNQLSKVVDYISQLSEVDTAKAEPTSQTTGLENVYRIDELKTDKCLNQEEALSGTDKTHNGYFMALRVLTEKSDG